MFSNVRVASILIPLAVAGVLAGNVPAAHATAGTAQCRGRGWTPPPASATGPTS
ncbi:hypothetical protein ACNF49_32460 [Actinomadura sp. ATCC 39365]